MSPSCTVMCSVVCDFEHFCLPHFPYTNSFLSTFAATFAFVRSLHALFSFVFGVGSASNAVIPHLRVAITMIQNCINWSVL